MKRFLVLITCWLVCVAAPAQTLKGTREEREARRKFMAELRETIFPLVKFEEATLPECVVWLKKQGVAIELAPELEGKAIELVTFKLKQVPASDVIALVAFLTNLNYEVTNGKVRLVPFGTVLVCSYTQEWEGLPLAFFGEHGAKIAAKREPADKGPPKPNEVQAFFEKEGIGFGDGEWALYSIQSQQLVVNHSTREAIERIDDLIWEFEKKQGKKKEGTGRQQR